LINPSTGDVYQEGDRIPRPGFAQTLRVIQSEGADAVYTGSLAQTFVDDIQDMGGLITLEDLANYQ
jgi:gamma-glutamyltranspeptidase